eukprot:5957134-Alexandrium_andersonii.AAC.1
MLPRDGNGMVRQHALAMAMWPQAGRGAAPFPPRAILHHLAEEPISVQIVTQESAGVEMEAAVERAVLQLRREG